MKFYNVVKAQLSSAGRQVIHTVFYHTAEDMICSSFQKKIKIFINFVCIKLHCVIKGITYLLSAFVTQN